MVYYCVMLTITLNKFQAIVEIKVIETQKNGLEFVSMVTIHAFVHI